ncbi:MAG: trypsin-like peptidase domain-containing protein [Clostridia bacterium]|nr:trypsin-like peptidase domain-containing protein [Clostridia bacterium]
MKKAICILAALCALLLVSAFAEGGFALDPARMNEAAKSVVILEQKDEEGNVTLLASGFAAIEPGLVVTSASFVQTGEAISAITDSGEALTVSGILGVNTDSDIAIIALEDKDKLAPLGINSEKQLLRGSDCVVVGAQGKNISVSIGNISNLFEEEDVSLIQFTSPLSLGSGGSPVFDEDGNVAGVTVGYYDDRTGSAQNLNFAVNISEALSLYEIVKEDEIAPFSDWAITDVGLKSYQNSEPPLEFYVKNNTDYEITKVFLFAEGEYPTESRISGRLKKGESATIQVTQKEYNSKTLWRVRVILSNWKDNYYTTQRYSVSYLMGKTFEFSNLIDPENNTEYISYELNKTYAVQRRHVPENAPLQVEEEIPYNCIRIVNDTDSEILEYAFSHIGLFRDLTKNMKPGEEYMLFISDYDINKTDKFILRLVLRDQSGLHYYDWTFNRADIFGKTMRFYNGEDGKVTYELK